MLWHQWSIPISITSGFSLNYWSTSPPLGSVYMPFLIICSIWMGGGGLLPSIRKQTEGNCDWVGTWMCAFQMDSRTLMSVEDTLTRYGALQSKRINLYLFIQVKSSCYLFAWPWPEAISSTLRRRCRQTKQTLLNELKFAHYIYKTTFLREEHCFQPWFLNLHILKSWRFVAYMD